MNIRPSAAIRQNYLPRAHSARSEAEMYRIVSGIVNS